MKKDYINWKVVLLEDSALLEGDSGSAPIVEVRIIKIHFYVINFKWEIILNICGAFWQNDTYGVLLSNNVREWKSKQLLQIVIIRFCVVIKEIMIGRKVITNHPY